MIKASKDILLDKTSTETFRFRPNYKDFIVSSFLALIHFLFFWYLSSESLRDFLSNYTVTILLLILVFYPFIGYFYHRKYRITLSESIIEGYSFSRQSRHRYSVEQIANYEKVSGGKEFNLKVHFSGKDHLKILFKNGNSFLIYLNKTEEKELINRLDNILLIENERNE